MFLQAVKVVRFAESKKVFNERYRYGGHEVVTYPNPNPDDMYFVIGVTSLKEGEIDYDSEEGYMFCQSKSHKVYIVAKSIGRRFKVLEEDLIRL